MPAGTSVAETRNMRKAVAAGFLGWTIDAFDFFVLVFCVSAIAKDFGRSVPDVALTREGRPQRFPREPGLVTNG